MFDVVMPLYNKEEFVEAAIESVLGQGFRDWRLFVVDDGSTDRGAERVGRFKDPRIALIRQSNQGVGPARNAGVREGSAAWIAFLDADDAWDADHLEELHRIRLAFPKAVLIGTAFARFSGTVPARNRPGRPGEVRQARYFAESARGRELFFTSSSAVRRSAIDEVGGFAPLPGNEDVELFAKLALHGPVAVSSRPTVHYRVDTGGITDRGMQGRKPDRPMRREELSSTIPTLARLLPEISDKKFRGEIAEYMDSRVGLSVVRAVRSGDMAYARHLLSLYEGRPRGQARLAAILARFPDPLGRLGLRAGLLLKRAYSRLKRREA